ncbi:hypothetical protein LTR94_026600, partial [Friedmanniomyces endolithicus]
MTGTDFLDPDEIRARFSQALSQMYRTEVPQYGELLDLVAQINADTRAADPELDALLQASGEAGRLDQERHGAIRVGSPNELATIAQAFRLMGMYPVGYYDLAPAGVPVHSTAFRPIDPASLARNPFRVFTSLLRLELIEDLALRREAQAILSRREIFSPEALELIGLGQAQGGLTRAQSERFVSALLETFRWHMHATVSVETYEGLLAAHRLVADVVSFKGPHINHLTPRTLDIDAAQAAMPLRGIRPKETIEGPPQRTCPILLRQTSFKALEEAVAFADGEAWIQGAHTARFGEIEQRGAALTPKGRALYDLLLDQLKRDPKAFDAFPDDWVRLRREGLAWFRFRPGEVSASTSKPEVIDIEALIDSGQVIAEPITYEDFLPVSAAGIFQSNLGEGDQASQQTMRSDRSAFEAAIGCGLEDEMRLYELEQAQSLAK